MSPGRWMARWTSIAALEGQHAAWQALSAGALEPNPFYAPDFLLAAQRHLQPARPIRCLTIHDQAQGGQLCGLLPLERPHWRDGALWGALSLYRNAYTCLTIPLIRAQDADDILSAALNALAAVSSRLILPMIPEERGLKAMLAVIAERRALALVRVDGHARPALCAGLPAQTYRQTRWKREVRASDARRARRLAERGAITYRVVKSGERDGAAALDAFLALEAKGWKGEAGTALAATPRQLAFARDAFTAGSGAWFEILALDGRPIAINLSLAARNAGYALKSAYDEDFAAYGVGNLLDGYSLGLCQPDGPLERLDSCTSMHHPLHQRWGEREAIGRYLLALEPRSGMRWPQRWLALWGPLGLWRGYD